MTISLKGLSMDKRIVESGDARNGFDGIEQEARKCSRSGAHAMA